MKTLLLVVFALLVLAVHAKNIPKFGRGRLSALSNSHDDGNNKDFNKIESDGDDNTKARVQFMITHEMKSRLQRDLGYLPEEIEAMEPQIARVVIEKGLVRPAKGMPDSWRRPTGGRALGSLFEAIQSIQNMLGQAQDMVSTNVKPYIVPIIGVAIVAHYGSVLWGMGFFGAIGEFIYRKSIRSRFEDDRIDMHAMRQVHKGGPWQQLKLQLGVLKNKLF